MDYHLIGVGGIGMSALARLLLQKGCRVSGTDQAQSLLLEELQKEGALISLGHKAEAVSALASVVYSSSIRSDHVEMVRAKALGRPILHRADLLAELMEKQKGLVVVGSHGKTTTSALLAEVVLAAGLDPSFAVGGILQSCGMNARLGKGEYFVAEADESDGSFLKLPRVAAIVTNLGDDHLDFWKKREALCSAFSLFCEKTPLIIWCKDDPGLNGLKPAGISYGFSEEADWKLSEFKTEKEGISFQLAGEKVRVPLFGIHNALNAAAVFVLAEKLQIPRSITLEALARFQGTKRRLEKRGEVKGLELYEDYGHHPTEIQATLKALRQKVGERRLVAVFQPHRYTRFTHHFAQFLKSFDETDLLIVTDIYGAGEPPILEPSLSRFLNEIKRPVHYVSRENFVEEATFLLQPLDTVVLFGAGDIGKSATPLLARFGEVGKKLNVGILLGGNSNEHEISKISAASWEKGLSKDRYEVHLFPISREGKWGETETMPLSVIEKLLKMDVVVPVLHGPHGEDGMVQGFLQTIGIPYVGCDYRAAPICMHKGWTKRIALSHGIPTVRFVEVSRFDYRQNPEDFIRLVKETLTFPVWVKGVHLGSSLGVTRVAQLVDLEKGIEAAFAEDDALLVEEEIVGKEIEFSLFGNDRIEVSKPAELLTGGSFYDFQSKYGPKAAGVQIPAPLTPLLLALGQDLAATMYRAAGCKGLARIDFFLDRQGNFWLNEINPFPGFTPSSGYPKMWEASGVPYSKLLDQLIICALYRSRKSG